MSEHKVHKDKNWLQEHYWERKASLQDCAKSARCSDVTILYWLKKHNISRRTLSDATKIAHAQGKLSKVYTEERNQKISEAWARGDFDSEEYRKKLSAISKARWESRVFDNEEYRKKKSDAAKAARARGCYDGCFQSPTSIEITISKVLDKLGIEHIKQFRPESCSYTYDEYLPRLRILLEINGDYWHTLPNIPEKDARKEVWAKEHGFTPITIWESEIKEHGALAMVQERVR